MAVAITEHQNLVPGYPVAICTWVYLSCGQLTGCPYIVEQLAEYIKVFIRPTLMDILNEEIANWNEILEVDNCSFLLFHHHYLLITRSICFCELSHKCSKFCGSQFLTRSSERFVLNSGSKKAERTSSG